LQNSAVPSDNETHSIFLFSQGVEMVKRNGDYREIIVESVVGTDSQGRPKRQIRPVKGQIFDTNLNVECSKSLSEKYPLGTRFKIRAQLTDMDGTPFLYSYHGWPFEVIA
jgi:hypothetical protein